MITILVYIMWVLYATLEGSQDAFMYNVKDIMKSNNMNEHYIFTAGRTIVLVLACMLDPWMILLGPLSFSFFHNGSYYFTRNWLDDRIYPKGWFDQSFTSTAKTTTIFTPVNRTVLFLISIIIILIINVCH